MYFCQQEPSWYFSIAVLPGKSSKPQSHHKRKTQRSWSSLVEGIYRDGRFRFKQTDPRDEQVGGPCYSYLLHQVWRLGTKPTTSATWDVLLLAWSALSLWHFGWKKSGRLLRSRKHECKRLQTQSNWHQKSQSQLSFIHWRLARDDKDCLQRVSLFLQLYRPPRGVSWPRHDFLYLRQGG